MMTEIQKKKGGETSSSVTTDEEERGSQTGDVNSVTLNMLGKVNKDGRYCHKIF
jgi:hypothetical protein